MQKLKAKYEKYQIEKIKKKAPHKKLMPRVVIDSFLGNVLDSNCIAIANDLVNHYPVIFGSNKPEKCTVLDPRIKIIKYGSLEHIKYLHSSKILINNARYNKLLQKHPLQIYIQIWHGIPYKKLVFDQADISSAWIKSNKYEYLAKFLLEINKWDYLFAQNTYTAEKFKSCFLYDKNIIQANYPSDIESDKTCDPNKILEIKNQLNLPLNKKIVLYTPTFREYCWDPDNGFKLSGILPEQFFQKHENCIFLVRIHYLIQEHLQLAQLSNVVNVTDYPYIDNLYSISDLLITDYSSTLFEYARTKKPIISFQSDQHEYRQKRGLYALNLTDLGIEIYTDWQSIVLDFNKKSILRNEFELVADNLVDEINKIIADNIEA